MDTHEFDERISKLTTFQARLLIERHYPSKEENKLESAFDKDTQLVGLIDEYYEGTIDYQQFGARPMSKMEEMGPVEEG